MVADLLIEAWEWNVDIIQSHFNHDDYTILQIFIGGVGQDDLLSWHFTTNEILYC